MKMFNLIFGIDFDKGRDTTDISYVICGCGAKNNIDRIKCHSCGKDLWPPYN